jgi:peptide/nickel transport system ATP-binding protein
VTHRLEVEDLHVWFENPGRSDVHAVRGVSFVLDRHEKLGLVGESGSGKTTTMLALAGLLPSSAKVSGRVSLEGQNILTSDERQLRPHRWTEISMVFQGSMNAFNPVLTVSRQIADVIETRGRRPRTEARQRARELLGQVGIPDKRVASYPHQLSGGMRQRAAIALALACDPKLVLADEPTTALDVMVQAQVMELLKRLCEERELALLLVSHDLMLVAEVCERLSVMYAGQIIESGSNEQMMGTPAHPYTERLFGATADIYSDIAPLSIPGAPPRLDRPVMGCPFRDRCSQAIDRCAVEQPLLQAVGPGQLAACHLNDLDTDQRSPSSNLNGTGGWGRHGAS